MPSLDALTTNKEGIHALFLGRSGAGKTGALAALANAGYKLYIADFDNGYAPLLQYVKPEFKNNVNIEVLTDETKLVGDKVITKAAKGPTAIPRFMSLLDKWDGGVASWGSDTVFVLDTLTSFGRAAMRYTLFMNGAESKDHISQPMWGVAMKIVEDFLELLTSSSYRCHYFCNAHVTYQEGDSPEHGLLGLPMALGSKLSPKVGSKFNFTLYARSVGHANPKRIISTQPMDGVETKCPIPGIPAQLPIESGLLTIFQQLGYTPTLESKA